MVLKNHETIKRLALLNHSQFELLMNHLRTMRRHKKCAFKCKFLDAELPIFDIQHNMS